MRQSVAILVVAILVLAHAFVEEAVGQKPVQYIAETAFEPLVITATPAPFEIKITARVPKVERCTVCNFKRPLVIVGKIATKRHNSGRTAYASMVRDLKSIVAKTRAEPLPEFHEKIAQK